MRDDIKLMVDVARLAVDVIGVWWLSRHFDELATLAREVVQALT